LTVLFLTCFSTASRLLLWMMQVVFIHDCIRLEVVENS
jgi:hypothetical protein